MKFLICGLGSIGQRHYRNLLCLGPHELIVFRSGQGNADFVNSFINELQPKIFNNLGEALSQKPDAVIVANPTSLHAPTALEAAQAGCHVFLEKPVSDKLDQPLMDLSRLVKEKKLIAAVGYNLRFHPLLREVRRWLMEGRIGQVLYVRAAQGEFVADWHPQEDYKKSYACRADLGGGVVLTQSHELDYLYWFFGKPSQIKAIGGKIGGLQIDVEDTAEIIMQFSEGMTVSLHLDYLQRPPQRKLEIIGTEGRIFWDYYANTAELYKGEQCAVRILNPTFNRNDMYLAELREFVECLELGHLPENNLEQGIEVLNVALTIKGQLEEVSQ